MNTRTAALATSPKTATRPVPIVALDVATVDDALDLVGRIPRAEFVKVGLQLYTSAGPAIVRELRERGYRVFLDLKLHDIPNTVAGAVRSASALDVDLLTVHASGGSAMLRAAATAAIETGDRLRLLGVTVLTSLGAAELAEAWGRPAVNAAEETIRLARLTRDAGLHGVVGSLQEAEAIRRHFGDRLALLCPGIRLPGDALGDQTRVGTPEDAARLGVDYIVIGRTVTAAPDPAEAYEQVLLGLGGPAGSGVDR